MGNYIRIKEVGGIMLSLFNKNSIKNIDKSIKKYEQQLKNDLNLSLRVRYNGRQYTTYVESFDEREVIFRCPTDEYQIVRFKEDTIIRIEFISSESLYTTELLITNKIVRGQIVYYRGEINSQIQEKQRRKSNRLPLILDLKYTILPAESAKYSANTIDISSGGMLIETDENIKSKDIRVLFKIEGQSYSSKAKILKKRISYKNDTYLYNIKFIGLHNRHINQIHKYVADNLPESKKDK